MATADNKEINDFKENYNMFHYIDYGRKYRYNNIRFSFQGNVNCRGSINIIMKTVLINRPTSQVISYTAVVSVPYYRTTKYIYLL